VCHSFLRLWSWPSLFRDQRSGGGTAGKEICDLLVVFGRHLFIFSDKYCAFPDTGDIALDWCRWYKRAIKKSADQVWGAERWLRDFPDRVFVDEACTQRLPINLPNRRTGSSTASWSAHGSGQRCRDVLGGSGSLMICPAIVGSAHCDRDLPRFSPFAVGLVEADRPFVHVLDDFSLDALLRTLDTAHDFAAYLQKRRIHHERPFAQCGGGGGAACVLLIADGRIGATCVCDSVQC
jgi:hypothetical protein